MSRDCSHEGENMLVINPDECIDCGVCEPECPAGAIVADTQLGGESTDWVELNAKYSELWPNITTMKELQRCRQFSTLKKAILVAVS